MHQIPDKYMFLSLKIIGTFTGNMWEVTMNNGEKHIVDCDNKDLIFQVDNVNWTKSEWFMNLLVHRFDEMSKKMRYYGFELNLYVTKKVTFKIMNISYDVSRKQYGKSSSKVKESLMRTVLENRLSELVVKKI